MKAIIKILSLLFFLISAIRVQASIQLTFEYKYEYTMSFMLKMEGLQNESHYIRIEDKDGMILLNEKSEDQDKFQRMYNLENLPLGEYTVIIENEHQLILQPILMNGRFLKIDNTEQKEVYKPALTLKKNALVINMLHFEKSPIHLTLKDKSDAVIYSNAFKTYGSLNKQLNITQLPDAEYLLEIATENYTVTKNINATQQVIYAATEF